VALIEMRLPLNAVLPSLAVFGLGLAGCTTLPVEDACRAEAAAQGVKLNGDPAIEPLPEPDQVLYQWFGSGVDCMTKRGHVQSVTVSPITLPE
jgi:hypothetical protein